MDDYDTDLQLDDQDETDVWAGEDQVSANGMLEELWSDNDSKQPPAEPPSWVDRLADNAELQRLCGMGVLSKVDDVQTMWWTS